VSSRKRSGKLAGVSPAIKDASEVGASSRKDHEAGRSPDYRMAATGLDCVVITHGFRRSKRRERRMTVIQYHQCQSVKRQKSMWANVLGDYAQSKIASGRNVRVILATQISIFLGTMPNVFVPVTATFTQNTLERDILCDLNSHNPAFQQTDNTNELVLDRSESVSCDFDSRGWCDDSGFIIKESLQLTFQLTSHHLTGAR
jgi:hypothetical protein